MGSVSRTHPGPTMFALLSDEERGFLHGILLNPAELTGWNAYADWLRERDDPRAEYLDLELRRLTLPESDPRRTPIRLRMDELRPSIDPDWIAVFDRAPVENCAPAFNHKCPRRWEKLQATDRPRVRNCGVCEKSVTYCHDVADAREHVQLGECVVLLSSLPRAPLDLSLDPLEAEAWACLLDDPRLGLTKDGDDGPHSPDTVIGDPVLSALARDDRKS